MALQAHYTLFHYFSLNDDLPPPNGVWMIHTVPVKVNTQSVSLQFGIFQIEIISLYL